MLASHLTQGAGFRDPCLLSVRRVTEILGNVFAAPPGKAAAMAAAPDLLGSFGTLLEHEDGQGDGGNSCPSS